LLLLRETDRRDFTLNQYTDKEIKGTAMHNESIVKIILSISIHGFGFD